MFSTMLAHINWGNGSTMIAFRELFYFALTCIKYEDSIATFNSKLSRTDHDYKLKRHRNL